MDELHQPRLGRSAFGWRVRASHAARGLAGAIAGDVAKTSCAVPSVYGEPRAALLRLHSRLYPVRARALSRGRVLRGFGALPAFLAQCVLNSPWGCLLPPWGPPLPQEALVPSGERDVETTVRVSRGCERSEAASVCVGSPRCAPDPRAVPFWASCPEAAGTQPPRPW